MTTKTAFNAILESSLFRLNDLQIDLRAALISLCDARALLADIRDSRLSPGLCERMRGQLRAHRRDMHSAFATIKDSNKALAAP